MPKILFKREFIDLVIVGCITYIILAQSLLATGLPSGSDCLGFVARAKYLGKDYRWLYIWRPHGFGYVEDVQILDFVLAPIYLVCGDPSFTVKLVLFISFFVAGLSMYAYVLYQTRKNNAALIASIVYVLNQWLFRQFAEGHIQIMLSYALAPLLFLFTARALKDGNLKNCLNLGLILSIFATGFHPQAIYIFGIFLLLYILSYVLFPGDEAKRRIDALKRLLKVSLVSGSIAALLSSFYFLPFFLGAKTVYLSASYVYNIEEASLVSTWFIEKTGFHIVLFIIPLALVVALLYKDTRSRRYAIYFSFSALIAAFIAKGPIPPLDEVNVWLHFNFPYMHVFRAYKRWMMMTMLSYSFLVGLLVAKLQTHSPSSLEKKFKGTLPAIKSFLSMKRLVCVFLTLVILANAGATGLLFLYSPQIYNFPEEIVVPLQLLVDDPDDCRIAQVGPWGYGNSWWGPGPLGTGYHELAYDSYYLHDKTVLHDGGRDLQAKDFFYFTKTSGEIKRVDDLTELLGAFNVKYIVFPNYPMPSSPQMMWQDIFNGQPGIENVLDYGGSVLLKNTYWTPRIFVAPESSLILGGREAIFSLMEVPNFNLTRNGLIFVDQNIDSLTQIQNSVSSFIISDSSTMDLAMLLLGSNYVIPLGQYAHPSVNATEYWIRSGTGRDYGKLMISSPALMTEGNKSVEFEFNAKEKSDYEVFIRSGFASDRGNLTVLLDDQEFGTVYPCASSFTGFEWISLGQLHLEKNSHKITLINDGTGWNYVDAVALVPPPVLHATIDAASNFIRSFPGYLITTQEGENLFGRSPILGEEGWSILKIQTASNGFAIGSKGYFENIAIQGKASSSSVESEGLGAEKANDGQGYDLTRWSSDKGLPQWFELEWAQPQKLWNAHIIFEAAFAEEYKVQVWNGLNWSDMVVVENNTLTERFHLFNQTVETTKLRFYFTKASSFNSVSVWEVETYSPSLSSKIDVPRDGEYMFAARLAGQHNTALKFEVENSSAIIPFDGSYGSFDWFEFGPITLDAGECIVDISWLGSVQVDELVLYSLKNGEERNINDLFQSSSSPAVTYQKINPTLYNVQVRCTKPSLLIFSDTYNLLWKAYVDDQELPHVAVNSLVNGFLIDRTGEFDVTIYLTGQTYADFGLRISAVVLIVVIAILVTPSKVLNRLKNSIRQCRRSQK